MKFDHYLRTVFVIGKNTDIFQGDFVLGVDFHRKNLPWRSNSLSLPTQFCWWRSSKGIIRKLFSTCFDFWEKTHERGHVQSDRDTN